MIDSVLALLLVLSVLALAHTYVLYPLSWRWLGARIRPCFDTTRPPSPETSTKVSVIIAAYNEERFIEDRVRNLLACDYPADLLEILIASDGSSDRTVELARAAAGGDSRVQVLDYQDRSGKVGVLNRVCALAKGETLVFSDANVAFEPDALRLLVDALKDERVGCVCGKLRLRAPAGQTHAETEGLYWKLESWLKTQEGARGVLLGANGAIYALRRAQWQPVAPDTVVEDFYIPMRLLMDGFRIVFDPRALAWEDMPPSLKDEFGRRIRIGAGDYQALSRCLPLLTPAHGLAAWVFFSHKVLRWMGPLFLIIAFLSALVLTLRGCPLGTTALLGQVAFYALALLGLKVTQGRGLVAKLSGAAAHFVSMNAALFLGFFRWLTRTQRVTWQRTAR